MKYKGSCHCKKVKYEFDLPNTIDDAPIITCNCSYCFNVRFWEVRVFDIEHFKITDGEENVKLYQFGQKETYHYWCNHCGIHTHGFSEINKLGKPFYFINIPTINNLSSEHLSNLKNKTKYIDGENEKWEDCPKYINYL